MSKNPKSGIPMTLSTRLFLTGLVSTILLGLGYALIQGLWETTSIQCRPQESTAKINCHIHQETYPGQSIDTEILKTDLAAARIKYGVKSQRGPTGYRVILVTTAGQEIMLTRSFRTDANEQLARSLDVMNRFIRDPHQSTLSVQTSRNWLAIGGSGGFTLFVSSVFLTIAWKTPGRSATTKQ